MKTLNLHVDYIQFKPLKKALRNIGGLSEKEKKGERVDDALVVLTAVEKGELFFILMRICRVICLLLMLRLKF